MLWRKIKHRRPGSVRTGTHTSCSIYFPMSCQWTFVTKRLLHCRPWDGFWGNWHIDGKREMDGDINIYTPHTQFPVICLWRVCSPHQVVSMCDATLPTAIAFKRSPMNAIRGLQLGRAQWGPCLTCRRTGVLKALRASAWGGQPWTWLSSSIHLAEGLEGSCITSLPLQNEDYRLQ